MARWAPAKTDILDELVAEIRHNYARGRVSVAVDGLTGSGTAGFADELAEAFRRAGVPVVRASIDAFQVAEPDGDAGPSRFYAEAYDYAAFTDRLARPFRREKPFALAPGAEPQDLEGDAVLIVDGVFLLRPELIGAWSSTVVLFVPADEAFARAGLDPASVRAQAEHLYLDRVQPRVKAIANVDNTDPEHPRRTFADSC
jgi:uridine kinase